MNPILLWALRTMPPQLAPLVPTTWLLASIEDMRRRERLAIAEARVALVVRELNERMEGLKP